MCDAVQGILRTWCELSFEVMIRQQCPIAQMNRCMWDRSDHYNHHLAGLISIKRVTHDNCHSNFLYYFYQSVICPKTWRGGLVHWPPNNKWGRSDLEKDKASIESVRNERLMCQEMKRGKNPTRALLPVSPTRPRHGCPSSLLSFYSALELHTSYSFYPSGAYPTLAKECPFKATISRELINKKGNAQWARTSTPSVRYASLHRPNKQRPRLSPSILARYFLRLPLERANSGTFKFLHKSIKARTYIQ